VQPAVITSLLIALALSLSAASRSVWDGVYTKAQAARGQSLYSEECAKCHGQNLAGGDGSPELVGPDFVGRWSGKSVGDLYQIIRKTMPTDDPGHLSTRQYAALAAYLLNMNDFPAGEKDLDPDPAALNDIRIEKKK